MLNHTRFFQYSQTNVLSATFQLMLANLILSSFKLESLQKARLVVAAEILSVFFLSQVAAIGLDSVDVPLIVDGSTKKRAALMISINTALSAFLTTKLLDYAKLDEAGEDAIFKSIVMAVALSIMIVAQLVASTVTPSYQHSHQN